MRSDYLDTSNPHRLKAFFLYVNAANMARGAANAPAVLNQNPDVQRCLISILAAERQRAEQAALDLFDPYPSTK